MKNPDNDLLVEEMNIADRIKKARETLAYTESSKYLNDLVGTIGVDPLFRKRSQKD